MINTSNKEPVIIRDLLSVVMKQVNTQAVTSWMADEQDADDDDTPVFYIGMYDAPEFPHAA